ncbi:exopolysaccharide biosynthesis protein [Clostridium botulinum]|uniref:protein-tyrosine-phosphatase n=2 Tax=Clostridium botulinum TaxID=1491 RepID=A0A9Q1UZW7_CLOBO|nr:CpsB/CapC family capsule biosynthesis tyrosine phosphatase [Clostridium botulinum]KEI03777.1 exopolysaccharide biosynthesis protein [Clostridium botulinum C/D str. Sp77]KOA79654.1 exopolysaccharide biosynthesis protein [Clostridium botulinum]KOA82610.1 exopolysaccharide biosynthesis protein [Clostridium botulinum]KOA85940.1 exopolysaccharide biosynthesis protein [Clostridium botulinum]KOA89476.1 exopolysaccharide biosynthesis protein [Clostridium botulinum]
MIDMHCHILPGIDDGSKDVDMSIKMLKIAEEDGIDKIIATPHFYRGHFENEYQDVVKKVEELNKIAYENKINVKIFPGQEIYIGKYTLKYYKEGKIKGLNNSNYMLIEFAMMDYPKDALDIIYELKVQGVKPIIAHPERYMYVQDDLSILNDFIKEECYFQVNAGSINGVFGKKVQKTSMKFIKNNICDFIASDAHTTGRRSPKLKKALMTVHNENKSIYEKIVANNSKLLNGDKLCYVNEQIKEKPSFFRIFRRK